MQKIQTKWYAAYGTLRYCPNSGWVVMDTPNSIVRYYSWWVRKLTWKKGSTPLHGSHCTVVNGKVEDVRKNAAWGLRQGAIIRFEYNSAIKTNGQYYWLTVRCPALQDIRRELGLKPFPKWEYHITIFYID